MSMSDFFRISLKKNRLTVFLINAVLWVVFGIPILWEKIFRQGGGSIQKILVLEFWGIGDLVLAGGILRGLREKFPQARIALLAKPEARMLFAESGWVDDFIEFSFPWTKFRAKYNVWRWDWRGLFSLIKKVRREAFDVSLDARGDVRNHVLVFLMGIKRRLGYGDTGGGMLLSDLGDPVGKGRHRTQAWDHLLQLLWSDKSAVYLPQLSVASADLKIFEDFLKSIGWRPGERLIGIHPGAGVKVRCWPLERFAQVAMTLRQEQPSKIIVFVEPDGYGQDIPIVGNYTQVQWPLEKLMRFLKRLDLLLCNDSGIMHIASALGVKTVAVFGPGDVSLIGPVSAATQIVRIAQMPCRPCFDYCRYAQPFCLTDINESAVVEVARTALNQAKAK